MNHCPLTPERLQRLLHSALGDTEQRELLEHLDEDCANCDALLDQEGMDEETLLLHLLAAGQDELSPQQEERSWAGISAAWATDDQVKTAKVRQSTWPRTSRWLFGGGALAAAAAAAVILLVVVPSEPPDTHAIQGVKGEAALPQIHLTLRRPSGELPDILTDGDVVEVNHGLERAAHVILYHWQQGIDPQNLFMGPLEASASGNGRFPLPTGHLGYAFDNEAGGHLFIALVADEPLKSSRARELLDAKWFAEPLPSMELTVNGQPVAVEMIRLEVQPSEAQP